MKKKIFISLSILFLGLSFSTVFAQNGTAIPVTPNTPTTYPTPCQNGERYISKDKKESCIDGTTTTQATESTSGLSPYEPLAPIPGISGKTINSDSFALSSYVRNVVRIAIGVIGILAVVMIIIGGVQYMSTDAYTGKESGKETVTKAIGGLILALASVLILRTINPQLTSLELTDQFKMDAITAKDIDIPKDVLSNTEYKKITGKDLLSSSQYEQMAKKMSLDLNIDPCLIIATAKAESDFRPNLIGRDADVKISGVASRVAFINSGIKYSGATFDKNTPVTGNVENDVTTAKKDKSAVDWRFSTGFGILQTTTFPEGYCGASENCSWKTNPNYNIKDKVHELPSKYKAYGLKKPNGENYKAIDLLDPEVNFAFGIREMKGFIQQCKNDPYKTLRAFNTGSCEKKALHEEERISYYKQCKGI